MATPLASRRNAWWGLLFAYGIAGLSLCTLNGDWLARAKRDLLTGITETAITAAPTERTHEKTRRRLIKQTKRIALVVGRLLNDEVTSDDITARRRVAMALLLLAESER